MVCIFYLIVYNFSRFRCAKNCTPQPILGVWWCAIALAHLKRQGLRVYWYTCMDYNYVKVRNFWKLRALLLSRPCDFRNWNDTRTEFKKELLYFCFCSLIFKPSFLFCHLPPPICLHETKTWCSMILARRLCGLRKGSSSTHNARQL